MIILTAVFFISLVHPPQVIKANSPYSQEILPVLKKNCIKCHGFEKLKGDIRLDTLSSDFLNDRRSAEIWHDVSDQIKLGEMPPENEKPLTSEERKLITEWIDSNLEKAIQEMKGVGNEAVVRRINRAEYQYTMEDLLGLKMDYIEGLARDPLSKDGFLNNGKALGVSSLQIEHYLKTARKAFRLILNDGERPNSVVSEVKWNQGKVRGPTSKSFIGKSSHRLGRVNNWHGNFLNPPKSGSYGFFVSGLTLNIQGSLPELKIDSNESKIYEISSYAELFPMTVANVPDDKLNGVLTFRNALDDGNSPPKQLEKVTETKDKKGKVKKKKTKA